MVDNVIIPDPLVSYQQCCRFYHWDIASLERGELLDEFYALRPLLWGLPPDDWLRERIAKLEAELIKRQGNAGNEFRSQPKPKLAEGVKL